MKINDKLKDYLMVLLFEIFLPYPSPKQAIRPWPNLVTLSINFFIFETKNLYVMRSKAINVLTIKTNSRI